MPWQEQRPMDSRLKFISDYLSDDYTVAELSRIHGVSRKTAYKWINRFEGFGIEGLKELSRRPHASPNSTDEFIVKLFLDLKEKHVNWGPEKLLAYLKKRNPEISFPCTSTVGTILKRHNLVKARRKIHRVPPYNSGLIIPQKPNDVWGGDYKGQFRTSDLSYCYPLTITDLKSRYLISCTGLKGTGFNDAFRCVERAFIDYGMPTAIRTDNGVPFAGRTAGGLSRLSLWWIKLGIIPERIKKGKPQQNGIHERFHRTLKQETAINPRANLKCQQLLFESFREIYNEERPHKALNNNVPADYYIRSGRRYTGNLMGAQYEQGMKIRKVKESGEIKFGAETFYISQMIAGEYVGFREIEEDIWEIYYSFHKMAICDMRKKIITRT